MSVLYKCDRCGEVKEEAFNIRSQLNSNPIEGNRGDLCRDCFEDLEKFMESKPTFKSKGA